MIVMKFGGTSIQDAESISRVCQIVREHLNQSPVVVNSAMGKTTRGLLNIAQLAAKGDAEQSGRELQKLISYHQDIVNQIVPDFEKHPLFAQMQTFYKELQTIKDGLCVLRDLTPRSQDKFLAYGELIATTIITAALQASGIDAVWCDARELIITDDRFTHAQPLVDIVNKRIQKKIRAIQKNNQIPVIQGYIGATREGATTTLGFEGSDFTAALIGAAVDAEDVQIWKDVPGVMTADPEIFTRPLTVKQISFDEAAEITFFGAKVLHPSSIAPAREKEIPVHVFNSKDPEGNGTELSVRGAVTSHPVKSITYKRPVYLIALRNIHGMPFYDFFKMIFDILDRERLTPFLVNIAERSVKLVLNTSANLQHLMDDLNPVAKIDIIPNKATVTVIGQALIEHPGIAGRILNCLNDLPIHLVSHGASNMNTTVVLDADKVETAIERLHEAFFQDVDGEVFEVYGK